MSVVTFATYGWDKHKARVSMWRVKETTLHTMELLGGWPGAFAAQRVFHHKSRKTKFQIVFWFIGSIHLPLCGSLIYWRFHH